MSMLDRACRWLGIISGGQAVSSTVAHEPLREFIYLDEVSLASLLASQKGELTEGVLEQFEDSMLAEAGGKLTSGPGILPSAELSSRFQTSNSSSLQTSRKANAQSLFRELHKLEHLRLIKRVSSHSTPETIESLFSITEPSTIIPTSNLKRGELVEFSVELSASWIFQLSTMVSEFSDMFDDAPSLFIENVQFSDMYNAKNANKAIGRLLAGLIPIDGVATDYSVIEHDGIEYVVNNKALSEISIESKPLEIVGVTDHLAYWKDIRRILFSKSEFTMMCRVAKSDLQAEWNPIKLADMFKDFAPDMASQIEISSKEAFARSRSEPAQRGGSMA